MRKSSIHFAPVTNIKFAVSHSERTELSEPGYLLPKEHQLPNIVVDGSLSEADLTALFIKQKEGMTGQAKARGSSPFWEGVVVLKNTDGQEQSEYLKAWKLAYELATGHQVLHMSIHLDEGYIDKAGAVHYNPHAHVIVSRMNEKNRVIELKRKQLGEVQDLTAEILQMERGSTLEERGGKRGRKHIPHGQFRDIANQKRLEVEKEKGNADFYGSLLDTQTSEVKIAREKLREAGKMLVEKADQIEQLKNQYKLDREEFKRLNAEAAAAGVEKVKSQRDYQDLKLKHEAVLANLTKTQTEADKVPALVDQVNALKPEAERVQGLEQDLARLQKLSQEWSDTDLKKIKKLQAHIDSEPERLAAALAAQKTQLDEQYRLDRAALKASGDATQQD